MAKVFTMGAVVTLMALAPSQWARGQLEEVHGLDGPPPVSVEQLGQG